ncbi:FtsX-like permease family protein [Frondihabitans peucedani]|uniref:ABC3 transporter permease C-terminal domain-containing protein n=1 Tax=Frondihabitans peucedani TaxID=598626 RepID=A0ABP8E4J2_9MICO
MNSPKPGRRAPRGRRISGAALALRTLRAHVSSALGIALLSLLLAAAGIVTPQVTSALLAAGLDYDVTRATAVERDLTTTFPGGPAVGTAPTAGDAGTSSGRRLDAADEEVWGAFDSELASVRASLPSPLRRATGPAEYAATTSSMDLVQFPGGLLGSALSLTSGPGFASRVRIVQGSAPTAVTVPGDTIPLMLTRSSADVLRWRVGAVHEMTTSDGGTARARLTGIFVPRDRSDDFWGHSFGVLSVTYRAASKGPPTPVATGVVAGAGYPALQALPQAGYQGDLQTQAWFPIRSSGLDPANAATIATQVRRFSSVRHSVPSAGDAPLPFSTRLPDVVADAQARLATASSLSDSVLAGPLGAALALEILLARLVVTRARSALELIGARGAGPGWLRLRVMLFASVAAVPGAIVGGLLGSVAARFVAGSGPSESLFAAVVLAVALLPVVVFGLSLPRLVRREGRVPLRSLVEAGTVLLTVVSALVVARRGIGEAPPGAGLDPVPAALPVLLGLTGCIVALRLLGPLLDAARARAKRRRGPSLATGLALARRNRTGTAAPLFAATIGIAVALFCSVLGSTLSHGLDEAAHARVGADVSAVTSPLDFTTEIPFDTVPGEAHTAFVSDTAQVQIKAGTATVLATAVVVDPASLRRVQAGVPGAVPLPAALGRSAARGTPVVLSGDLADRLAQTGGTIEGQRLEPVEVSRAPLGLLPDTDLWLVVSESRASSLGVDNDAPDRTLLRLDQGADSRAAAAGVRRLLGGGIAVSTVDQVEAELSENPLVPGLQRIAVEAAVLAASFGLLSLLAATVLETAERRRRIDLLTLLGMSRSQRRRLVLAETAPLGATALAAGCVVAALMVALVLPSADLRSFTGAQARPAIHLDPVILPLLVLAGLAATAAVSAVAVALSRPLAPGSHRPEGSE